MWQSCLEFSRILFVEEPDNMANFSGPYLVQGNALLFVLAMLVWCCPTTQVTLHRRVDRGVVAVDAPSFDHARSDGRTSSTLTSGGGASIKQASAAVVRHQPRSHGSEARITESGAHSAGNGIPSGADNAQHFGSESGPLVRSGRSRTDQEEEKEKAGGGTEQSRSGHARTGDDKPGTENGEGDIVKDFASGKLSKVGVIGAIRETESNPHSADEIINDDPVESPVDGSAEQTTCEKCNRQRDEDLLEEFDPNALMQLRIESIKRRILDKLRMERPPQVNMSSVNVPAPLSQGTFIADDEDDEDVRNHVHHVPGDAEEEYDTSTDYYGKTTRVIITTKPEAPPCPLSSMASSCFEFDISAVVRSRIVTAELWLYWNGEESTSSSINQTLTISQLSGHGLRTSRAILSHHVPASQPAGWITVDIRHTVRRWRSHSHHDQVVKITCPTCESNEILPFAAENSYRPFIVVRVADEASTRRRRNVNCDVNTTNCCRQKFRVHFQDLGWDWVISPRGFDANYCRGSCANFNSPSLTHTSIMHTARSKNPSFNIPRPCCAPRSSGTLSMIYMNEDEQFYTVDMPEMRILSCGCS